jgi:hypothetical protein
MPGGQNLLHLAASAASAEAVEALLSSLGEEQSRLMCEARDLDGNTPWEVAVESRAFGVAQTLLAHCGRDVPDAAFDEDRVAAQVQATLRKRTARMTQAKAARRQRALQRTRQAYEPAHPWLIQEHVAEQDFVRRVVSDDAVAVLSDACQLMATVGFSPAPCAAAENASPAAVNERDAPRVGSGENANSACKVRAASSDLDPVFSQRLDALQARVRSLCTEVTDGVFHFTSLLKADAVRALRVEFQRYLESGLPVERPNHSIPFGLNVSATGLWDAFLHQLTQLVIQPLSFLLYRDLSAFWSHHCFVKHYRFQHDTDPSTHFDPADVTFSVCLGDTFRGSQVYFHAVEGECGCAAGTKRTPHPVRCDECLCTVEHCFGTVVLHRGRQVHGVYRLEEGERWQMIVWCRCS